MIPDRIVRRYRLTAAARRIRNFLFTPLPVYRIHVLLAGCDNPPRTAVPFPFTFTAHAHLGPDEK